MNRIWVWNISEYKYEYCLVWKYTKKIQIQIGTQIWIQIQIRIKFKYEYEYDYKYKYEYKYKYKYLSFWKYHQIKHKYNCVFDKLFYSFNTGDEGKAGDWTEMKNVQDLSVEKTLVNLVNSKFTLFNLSWNFCIQKKNTLCTLHCTGGTVIKLFFPCKSYY